MRGTLMLLAALAFVTGCADHRDESAGATPTPDVPHIALEGAEFGENDAGKPVWSASARHVIYRTGTKVAELTTVTARFFEHGKIVTHGRAPSAVWDEAAHDFTLGGGVTLATTSDQRQVTAADARWDAVEGQLRATGGVHFKQGANRLQASRLSGDRALQRVSLEGGVKGTFALGTGTIALWSGSKTP